MKVLRRSSIAVFAATALIGALSGCKVTALAPTQNDPLRTQVRDLSEQVASLKSQRTELQQQLAKCVSESTLQVGVDPEVATATPQVALVQIGSASHMTQVRVRQDDGTDASRCIARVYLEASDGLGRAIQIVGRVNVSLFELKAQGQARTLGAAQYSPMQVRDAWRGGVMGPHYTLEVPIDAVDWECTEKATVKIEFTDGVTGKVFDSQREITAQK